MAEYLKNNPVALRHCLLYEYLQKNKSKRAFKNIRDTIGSDVFTEEELRSFFSRKRKMGGDDRRITDMRDVLRNDTYALRACILYEYLKHESLLDKLAERKCSTKHLWPRSSFGLDEILRNPSFSLHSNFCEKLGEDAMGYPEFDFWFCRFVKGEYDLNYERDKDMKMLSDMPIDIMRIILQSLNVFDRVSLSGTSRSFKTFIENQNLFYEKLEFYRSYWLSQISIGNFKVFYERKNDNYDRLYVCGDFMTERRIRGAPYWKRAVIDLKNILKHPKLHLKEFNFQLSQWGKPDEEEVKIYDETIEALELPIKQLHVEELALDAYSMKPLFKILPSLKPGYLRTMNLVFRESDDDSMKKLVEMEQFKQAKYFNMRMISYDGPLVHFFHFEEFYINSTELSVEDIRQMKEILFNSQCFKKCEVVTIFDEDTIRQEFGDSIEGRPNIYHYPIVNSTEYFEIELELLTIKITRKNE